MSNVLVVYVPGLTVAERPGKSHLLLARIRTELGLGEQDTWEYPHAIRRFTRGRLAGKASALSESIQQYWESRGKPERIILIGHSIGGLLVRYAYLLGLGGLGGQERTWAGKVHRIVLLAVPNRGWDLHRLQGPMRWVAAAIVAQARGLAAPDALTGSAFITNLRLEWIRSVGAQGVSAPVVVQVRSGLDLLIEPEDSRDVEALPTGIQLVLPSANHADIPLLSGVAEDFPGQRWQVLRQAILDEDLDVTVPEPLPEREQRYQSVVFVLHGIRAGNDGWVDQLRETLIADDTVRVVPASYGRFSAYNFALPLTRRRNLRWFLDQYSYHLARHPNLPFHFVGHSNGTYMLGQALRHVSAIKFRHVYLAGSVLPREFDWRACAEAGQVREMVNVCATTDKPVGWLCSALHGIGMPDVGVGGFTGFDVVPDSARQFRYLPGGHGEALEQERLPAVANFVRTGQAVRPEDLVAAPSWVFRQASQWAPAIAVTVITVWLAIAVWSLIWFNPIALIVLTVVTVLIGVVLKFV